MSELSLKLKSQQEESLKTLSSDNKITLSLLDNQDTQIVNNNRSSIHQESKLQLEHSNSSIIDSSQRSTSKKSLVFQKKLSIIAIKENPQNEQDDDIVKELEVIPRFRSATASPMLQFGEDRKSQYDRQHNWNQQNGMNYNLNTILDDEDENKNESKIKQNQDDDSPLKTNLKILPNKKLIKMKTLKVIESITDDLKTNGLLTLDQCEQKAKLNIQELTQLVTQDIVDIKNSYHSELTLEILNKKKKKTKIEKQFLLKILQCCSVFQKNKNLLKDENRSLQMLDWISYQFMPKNSIVFNQGEYGNTYYIVLTGQVFCLIPDPDHKSKEKYINDQYGKREFYFSKNPYTASNTERNELPFQSRLPKHEQFTPKAGKDIDPLKKTEKDQLSLLIECFPQLKLVHTFNSGESFGDIALITSDRRTATLICKEDTHFITLTKEGYEQMIGIYEQRVLQENVKFLRQFSYFKNMIRSKLLQVLVWMKEETYYKKAMLYKENDLSNAVYFIRSGEIEISQATEISNLNEKEQQDQKNERQNNQFKKENDKILELNSVKKQKLSKLNKKRVQLVILGADQYFGQDEVLDNIPKRTQQAQCISQTANVFCLSKQRYIDMIRLNHTSVENIKNEEKLKSQWKQKRLQMIQETSKSNSSYKNTSQQESNKDQFKFLDSPSPSIRINTLNREESSSQSLNTSSDSIDPSFLNRLDYGDSVLEKNHQTSKEKRNFYSQLKNKTQCQTNFNGSSSRYDNFNNNSQEFNTNNLKFNLNKTKDITILEIQNTQQQSQIFSPITKKRQLIGLNFSQQSQMVSPQKLGASQPFQFENNNSCTNDIKSGGSPLNQIEEQDQDSEKHLDEQNQSMLNSQNNNSFLYRSLTTSPISQKQKIQINQVFSKFYQNQSISSSPQPQPPLSNIPTPTQTPSQIINSNMFSHQTSYSHLNACISPQNSSHMNYLKMVHQSLIAKQVILNQLKQSSHSYNQNNNKSHNKNFSQPNDLGNSLLMVLSEDNKLKQSNSFKLNNSSIRIKQLSTHQSSKVGSPKKQDKVKNLTIQSPKNRQQDSRTPSPRVFSSQTNYMQFQQQSSQEKAMSQTTQNGFVQNQMNHSKQSIDYQSEELNLNSNFSIPNYKSTNFYMPPSIKQQTFLDNMSPKKSQSTKQLISKIAEIKHSYSPSIPSIDNTQLQKPKPNNTQKQYFSNDDGDEIFNNEEIRQHMQTDQSLFQSLSIQIKDKNNIIQSQKQQDYKNKKKYFSGQPRNKSTNIDTIEQPFHYQNNTQLSNQSIALQSQLNSIDQISQNDKCLTLQNFSSYRGGGNKSCGSDQMNEMFRMKNKPLFTNPSSANIQNNKYVTLTQFYSPQRNKYTSLNDVNNNQSLQQQQQQLNEQEQNQRNSLFQEINQQTEQDTNKSLQSGYSENQKKPKTLQNDYQALIDFKKIGKHLKLDKIIRKSKESCLLTKLIEQQQAKIQNVLDTKNFSKFTQYNLLSNFMEKKDSQKGNQLPPFNHVNQNKASHLQQCQPQLSSSSSYNHS